MNRCLDGYRGLLVSVIVPIYNEAESVGKVLENLTKLKETLPLEIIAVDDGSTDGSREIVKSFPSVKLVCHSQNIGKGKSVATGMAHSKGQIVVIQDADCEYPPEEIPKIVRPILEGEADVVFGSRFMGNHDSMSISHKLGNKILSLCTSILYNMKVTDIMTGHKAFSRKAVESVDFSANGFEIEVEVTGKLLAQGWKFQEVPILYTRRQCGKAKIGYRDGFICLLKLLSTRFGHRVHMPSN